MESAVGAGAGVREVSGLVLLERGKRARVWCAECGRLHGRKCPGPEIPFMTIREIRARREQVRRLVAWLKSVENVRSAV